MHPDVVLIGAETQEAVERIRAIYENAVENKPYFVVMNAESAEVMKISLNCFVTTKIAYANMIGDIAEMTPGADKMEILEAIGHDSRVGSKCLMPGWSYGGPCFPRDNRALAGYADKIGFDAKISKATNEMNEMHVKVMAEKYLKQGKDEYVFEWIAYKQQCAVPITRPDNELKSCTSDPLLQKITVLSFAICDLRSLGAGSAFLEQGQFTTCTCEFIYTKFSNSLCRGLLAVMCRTHPTNLLRLFRRRRCHADVLA